MLPTYCTRGAICNFKPWHRLVLTESRYSSSSVSNLVCAASYGSGCRPCCSTHNVHVRCSLCGHGVRQTRVRRGICAAIVEPYCGCCSSKLPLSAPRCDLSIEWNRADLKGNTRSVSILHYGRDPIGG